MSFEQEQRMKNKDESSILDSGNKFLDRSEENISYH